MARLSKPNLSAFFTGGSDALRTYPAAYNSKLGPIMNFYYFGFYFSNFYRLGAVEELILEENALDVFFPH